MGETIFDTAAKTARKKADCNKYETDVITEKLEQKKKVTFLALSMLSDGSILKAEANTYQTDTPLQQCSSLSIIKKEERKRTAKTLNRFDISKEDLESGLEEACFLQAIQDYLKKQDSIVILYQTFPRKNAAYHMLAMCQVPDADILELKQMASFCGDSYTGKESLKKAEDTFLTCMRRYRRLKTIEKNKQDCILEYAYSFDMTAVMGVWCVTSICNLYYDTIKERWAVPKKEQKKTGLRIEQINIENLEAQLYERYHVKDMRGVELRLKMRRQERQAV